MEMVGPPDPLDKVKRFAVRVADAVQPGLVVEIHGVGDQRVSLPMPDRIAHPQGTESRVMLSAVRKYLMADRVIFKKHDDFARRLNHLHWEWMHNNPRVPGRSTGVVNRVIRFRERIGTSSEGGFGALVLRL